VTSPRLESLRQQWRGNRRLRIAALVAAAILLLHAVFSLADRRDALGERIAGDEDLLVRLERAATETAWPDRALEAQARLREMRASLPEAGNEGRARAELQAWLSLQASQAGLSEVQIRVQDVVDVEGHPELQQALARMDASLPRSQLGRLLDALGQGLPWVQVERLEISAGDPASVLVVVRAYYRREAVLDAPAAGAQVTPLGPDPGAGQPEPVDLDANARSPAP
jgi:hypothetical protein